MMPPAGGVVEVEEVVVVDVGVVVGASLRLLGLLEERGLISASERVSVVA